MRLELSLNQGLYKRLIWILWLVLPANALGYWAAWDHLPATMAVHFDANWQPDGFTSREGAVELGLGIMAFMLLVFTTAGLVVNKVKPGSSWPVLFVFCFALGVMCYGNYFVIKTNRNRFAEHPQVNINLPPN